MRAAVYYGNGKIEIEDVPEPTVGDGQVKVRISRNGICGTDLHEYFDGPVFVPPDDPHPLTGASAPGHGPRVLWCGHRRRTQRRRRARR